MILQQGCYDKVLTKNCMRRQSAYKKVASTNFDLAAKQTFWWMPCSSQPNVRIFKKIILKLAARTTITIRNFIYLSQLLHSEVVKITLFLAAVNTQLSAEGVSLRKMAVTHVWLKLSQHKSFGNEPLRWLCQASSTLTTQFTVKL